MLAIKDILVFRRVEKKYLLDSSKKEELLSVIGHRLIPDSHGISTISSIYLDTPTKLLIRNSMNGKTYKEKLRIRCYGVPGLQDKVFLEIKKKYKGVVYKRREAMRLFEAEHYAKTLEKPFDSQIMRELDYTMRFYSHPKPAMQISYDRLAFFVADCPELRITFDTEIRYRESELSLSKGNFGRVILKEPQYIMEIKTEGAMPLWLAGALDKCGIYPTSFSKYANCYTDSAKETTKGEPIHA